MIQIAKNMGEHSYVEYMCHRPSQLCCSRCPLLPEAVVAATARHRPATSNRAQCRLLVPCALCLLCGQSLSTSAQPVETMSIPIASISMFCSSTKLPSTVGMRRRAAASICSLRTTCHRRPRIVSSPLLHPLSCQHETSFAQQFVLLSQQLIGSLGWATCNLCWRWEFNMCHR